MSIFANTQSPTPFGIFDSDTDFQSEADSMVTFVKRKLGDDILSVELTKKQVWACFEEAFCEYGAIINEHQAKSQLANLLGSATGSLLSGSEQRFPRENFEFMLRRAEPYAMDAGLGGSYNTVSGSIDLEANRQDYDLYTELKNEAGTALFDTQAESSKTKLKITEVFHQSPNAAYRFFDTTSAINYLNNEFSFESFTPETIFYVLPVYEDVLRGGMMSMSSRVRRSNYSYKVMGTKIRLYPTPTGNDGNGKPTPKKLWVRVAFSPDPMNPGYTDETIYGVSNLSNVPYGNLAYSRVNSIGRQWVRQYTHALCRELLGLIRSKFGSVPIPGGDLTLNGAELITQGREDQANLKTKIVEMLVEMTYSAMLEDEAAAAENLTRILKMIPMPNGGAILMG
jgi:hypothetical protein